MASDTSSRTTDEQWRELFEEMPAFASVVEGPEFEVVLDNRRIRESPSGSIIGRKLADIYPGETPLRRALERVYATGVAETLQELPSYYTDGRHPVDFDELSALVEKLSILPVG